jgi:hypothetical protein
MNIDKRDLENSKSFLQLERDGAIGVMNFAIQHDMLGLFQQAKRKVDSLQVAINVIEDKLEGMKPLTAAPR